jgi:hypothetical protein
MAPRPFVVDPILTALAVGYKNPAEFLIADQVLPRYPVGQEKFKWTEYPISEAFNVPDARVGRRGRVQQLEFGGLEQTAEVEDFGLDSPIPFSDIESAAAARAEGRSTVDPEGHATGMLTGTIQNIREVRVAQMVHALATYSTDKRITLSGTSQFSDYTNSDPIGVIKTGMASTLIFRPNTMVMGIDVWLRLSSHPKIVNAVKGNVTNSGIVSREEFANLFRGEGINEVLIGEGWYNTAKQNQPVAMARAWGKHIALIHKNPMASVEGGGITFGMTAQFGGRIAGRIEDKDIGLQGGYRIRSGERVKELVIAKDVGYFIQNAVA